MLQNSFAQKVIMTIVSGFAAACLVWVFRHVIEQAFWESNEGWKDMYKSPPAKRVY